MTWERGDHNGDVERVLDWKSKLMHIKNIISKIKNSWNMHDCQMDNIIYIKKTLTMRIDKSLNYEQSVHWK